MSDTHTIDANDPVKPTEIEFFFDVASPYSYLATSQIDRLEADTGLPVRWRPFLLGGVFKATGNETPAALEARGNYMLMDLQDWARLYRIPLAFPRHFPTNSLTAMRMICANDCPGLAGLDGSDSDGESDGESGPELQRLAEVLFRSYWAERGDINDPVRLAETLERSGFDAEALLAASQQQEVKDRLKATTEEAVRRGAFGAPTFFVGDRMFFGNDRIEMLVRYCRRFL